MATTAARPRPTPEKARRPEAAARSGRPQKAQKPAAARRAPTKAKTAKSSGGHSASKAARKAGGAGTDTKASTAKAVGKAGQELVRSASPKPSSLKGKAALKLAKMIAHRMLGGGTNAVADFSRQGLDRGVEALESVRGRVIAAASTSVDVEATNRPPIQCSIDAGVPIAVAWAEWIRLEWLPEGVDRVTKIRRKNDGRLTGRLGEDGRRRWAAQLLDEREEESFAWESNKGSDCAGLITFYTLGERLTRIELSLDVRPVSVIQAVALSTRAADRRAAADLRRFKARLELITPDRYAELTGQND